MINFITPKLYEKNIIITHEVPRHYKRYKIPYALATYTKGSFGDFLVQVINCIGFTIQLNIFGIEKNICLLPVAPAPVVALHFMLQGNIRCRLKGFGKVMLTAGLFHLFFVPAKAENKAWFEPGLYLSFHIDNTKEFIQLLSKKYPELKEVLRRATKNSTKGVQQHAAVVSPYIRSIIDQIVKCNQQEPERTVYLQGRIGELLLSYVGDTTGHSLAEATPQSQKSAKKIDAFIRHNLNKPLDLATISAQFHLSRATIERLIRHVFHQSFHQLVTRRRLERAYVMLTTTDLLVKEVAGRTGFSSITSFTRSFRKKYRCSPGMAKKMS